MIDTRTKSIIRYYIPEEDDLDGISNLFGAFADQTRLKVLSALSISELCVGDIAEILGVNQTTISHQLKYLKDLNLVKSRRYGKTIFYAINGNLVSQMLSVGVSQLGYE
jgi:ArsR family transcriptional regulator